MVSLKSLRKEMAGVAVINIIIALALLAGCVKGYSALCSLALCVPPDNATLKLYGSLLAVTRTLIFTTLPVMSAFCLFVSVQILLWRRRISE